MHAYLASYITASWWLSNPTLPACALRLAVAPLWPSPIAAQPGILSLILDSKTYSRRPDSPAWELVCKYKTNPQQHWISQAFRVTAIKIWCTWWLASLSFVPRLAHARAWEQGYKSSRCGWYAVFNSFVLTHAFAFLTMNCFCLLEIFHAGVFWETLWFGCTYFFHFSVLFSFGCSYFFLRCTFL